MPRSECGLELLGKWFDPMRLGWVLLRHVHVFWALPCTSVFVIMLKVRCVMQWPCGTEGFVMHEEKLHVRVEFWCTRDCLQIWMHKLKWKKTLLRMQDSSVEGNKPGPPGDCLRLCLGEIATCKHPAQELLAIPRTWFLLQPRDNKRDRLTLKWQLLL